MPRFTVIEPPRRLKPDGAFVSRERVVCMYDDLYARVRDIGGAAPPAAVFEVAYVAALGKWSVDRAFEELCKVARERTA